MLCVSYYHLLFQSVWLSMHVLFWNDCAKEASSSVSRLTWLNQTYHCGLYPPQWRRRRHLHTHDSAWHSCVAALFLRSCWHCLDLNDLNLNHCLDLPNSTLYATVSVRSWTPPVPCLLTHQTGHWTFLEGFWYFRGKECGRRVCLPYSYIHAEPIMFL